MLAPFQRGAGGGTVNVRSRSVPPARTCRVLVPGVTLAMQTKPPVRQTETVWPLMVTGVSGGVTEPIT
jgi:hypothetical protein